MVKSMLLTTCSWNDEKYESFHLIPITTDCPYLEGIYDPIAKLLVLFSNHNTEHLDMIDQINEFGDSMTRKNKLLVERHKFNAPKELYIHKPEEIELFINLIAINASTFEFNKYLENPILFSKSVHSRLRN